MPGALFHGGFGYSIGMGFQPTWTEAPMYIADGIEREREPGITFHPPIRAWVPAQYGFGFTRFQMRWNRSSTARTTVERPTGLRYCARRAFM